MIGLNRRSFERETEDNPCGLCFVEVGGLNAKDILLGRRGYDYLRIQIGSQLLNLA